MTAATMLVAGVTVFERRQAGPTTTIGSGGDPGSLAAAGELSQALAPTTVAPTTTTAAPPSTTTTAVPRTSTTKVAATTAGTPPKSRQSYSGGFEPRWPGSVRLPFQAGQNVWSATSNGFVMTLRADTATPVAGTPVRFVLEAQPPAGSGCCMLGLVRSDGVRFSTETSKQDTASCATPATGAQRVETPVTFNKAGRFEFSFQAASLCTNPWVSGVVYGFIEVGAGRTTSQGPFVPVLQVNHAGLIPEPTDTLVRGVHAFARDDDGYIAGFSLNWGDGTPVETYSGDPLGCMQLPGGWTNASQTMMSSTPAGRTPPTHRYARAGTYTVTVHVWSTGCDGADEQRVSGTLNVSVA